MTTFDPTGSQDQEFLDFWNQVDEGVKSASSSTGTIGEIEISFGWKLYVAGTAQEETFFPCVPTDKASLAMAKGLANKYIVDHGLENVRPTYVFCIRIFKDTVMNKDVSTWKGDQFRFIATFDPDYLGTITQKLREFNVKRVGRFWAQVSWGQATPNPKKKPRFVQKLDADKNPIIDEQTGEAVMEEAPNLFAYVSKIYPNKEEAQKDAGGDTTSTSPKQEGGNGSLPEGYDEDAWTMVATEIKAEKEKGTPLPKIAEAYGLSMAWVTKALSA
jgi:hypothetical protein